MKILGAILLALACAGIGWCRVRCLSDSEHLWNDWVRLLMCLHSELRYTARPVQEVLASRKTEEYASLLWLEEFQTTSVGALSPVKVCEEEADFAREFFAFVGISDLEGQLAHMEHYIGQATTLLAQSRERRQRLSKVYLSTAVCLGISVGVMMI